jgi:plastocyanin domain-containing protein
MSRRFIARIKAVTLMLSAVIPMVAAAATARAEGPKAREPREIEIVVDGGYKPAKVTVKQGERVRLKFVRKEYSGCTRELVIPALQLRKELPPNKPVLVDLPALGPGDYEFRCGMNMVKGAITVVAS